MPAIGGERNVGGGKGGNEVVFIRPDGALGRVSAVVDGRDVLILDGGRGLAEKIRKVLTRLIV